MLRWLGPLAVLTTLGACSFYPAMSADELGFQQACDAGDWSACADLAHSVASDRPDTLAWTRQAAGAAP